MFTKRNSKSKALTQVLNPTLAVRVYTECDRDGSKGNLLGFVMMEKPVRDFLGNLQSKTNSERLSTTMNDILDQHMTVEAVKKCKSKNQ